MLDECAKNQVPCRIIVTQPRRIAATTIAQRISKERNDRHGQSVGHQIRCDIRVSNNTNLIFTTRYEKAMSLTKAI